MSNTLTKIKGIGLIFIPIALYFVPLNWLNGQHSICLFKNLFNFECWGCGITRAVISVIQLHFADAFHYNKFIVIVFSLLLYLYLKELIKCFHKKQTKKFAEKTPIYIRIFCVK